MSAITITKLYDLLSVKVGKETAENLPTFIEHKINNELENKSQILATKHDLAEVKIQIAETKVDLIKWIFAFWISLALMIIGLYLKN